MSSHNPGTKKTRERAVLVGVGREDYGDGEEIPSLDELSELAKTAQVQTVARIYQRRTKPDSTWYVGKGKADEIASRVRDREADVVLFDNELTPRQVRNLEERLGCKVLDRSEVILDIFASHARTQEAKLQVELAQLRYTLPRLKRMWTHLSRIAGQGGIGSRGPGEKQIETDRRIIDRRLHALEQEIAEIHRRKERQVATRAEALTVALVGYTNAGKSTLMNRLTGAGVYEADQLFATLDTKTSHFELDSGSRVLVSDTVGFIENLPHHLVASFHATLEEVRQARLLLHVVDASCPNVSRQIETVRSVLDDLGIEGKEELLVFNKMDAVVDQMECNVLRNRYSRFVEVSALTGAGVEQLVAAIADFDERHRTTMDLVLSPGDGRTLARLNVVGDVLSTDYREDAVLVRVSLPREACGPFEKFRA